MLLILLHQFPFSSINPVIVFFFLLSDALEWKYFVLSPNPNHWTLDLCYHIIFSLSSKSFISFQSTLISLPKLPFLSLWTKLLRDLLFSWIFFGTFPKAYKFHLDSSIAHCLSLKAISLGEFKLIFLLLVSSMIFLQSPLLVHITSKWKRRFLAG